ncbi:MAG: hypothetical protein KC613_13295 [Myxococcales bacterium]|nr:hypothetical protein [Myxococcales bacterium]
MRGLHTLTLLAAALGPLGLMPLGLPAPAHAQDQPVVLPYDGALDLDGTPADGLFDMRFALYAAPTGGEPLWSEEWTAADDHAVRLTQGRFQVALGRFSPIGSTLRHGTDLFLGIAIKAPAAAAYLTLAGRQRLDPVAHALYSLAGERLAVPELSVGGTATVAGAIELTDELMVRGTLNHGGTLTLERGLSAGDATVTSVQGVQQLNSDQITANLLSLTSLTVGGTLDAARLRTSDDDITFPQGVSTPAGAALFTRTVEAGQPVLQINGGEGLDAVRFEGPVQIGAANRAVTFRHYGPLTPAAVTVTPGAGQPFAFGGTELNVGDGTIHGWTSLNGPLGVTGCRICLNVRGQVTRHTCITLDGAQNGGHLGLPPELDDRSTFNLTYVCDGGASGAANGVVE